MNDERAQILQGIASIQAGRLKEAATLLGSLESPYSALHAGHAWRWLGGQSEADAQFQRALSEGERSRDRPLTVAALCGLGEVSLMTLSRRAALTHFGRALGLTELGGVSAVLPLAGLAQAQLLWHNRAKAEGLAARALERATAARDRAGEARAQLSLGLAAATTETSVKSLEAFERGRRAAQSAPHRPLELRLWVERLERSPLRGNVQHAYERALEFGMRPEALRLERLQQDTRLQQGVTGEGP